MRLILEVDIGNTRIKWRAGRGPVEALDLSRWSHMFTGLQKPASVWVSNVAGEEVAADFERECWDRWQISPRFASPEDGLGGLRLAYADASRLGVDRWLAMLAARSLCRDQSFLVVSAGTAVTADFVLGDGSHLGGVIAPGVQLVSDSLQSRARQLPRDHLSLGSGWQLGATTRECLEGGLSALYLGFLCQLERMAASRLGDCCWLFTGGAGATLMSLLSDRGSCSHHETLVLDGLALANLERASAPAAPPEP